MPTTVKTPTKMGAAGRRLWTQVTSTYELRADELVTLEAACRASDRIVAMEAERAGAVTATGSMGQLVVHPLVAEIRAHEAQVAGLLAKLKLPEDSGGAKVSQQRAAAQSRWAAAHGKAS